MRTLATCLFATLALSACTDDAGPDEIEVPGRTEPTCTMTWRAFRVTEVEIGRDYNQAMALAFDLDHKSNDGVDNQIGSLLTSMLVFFPESWDAEAVFDARLAAGRTPWVIEVGSCADGAETRTISARATDVDGDGRLEIVDRGLAAVGHAAAGSTQIAGERGVGWIPAGGLFAGSPTAATDAWQRGLSLAADLVVNADTLTGRIGIGLNPDDDAAMVSVQNFFNERLTAGTSQFAHDADRNGDGTIDGQEIRRAVSQYIYSDLDLADGTCDGADCYAPHHVDLLNDHASLALAITAEPVELE